MRDNIEAANKIVPIGMGIDSHALLFRSNGSILRAVHDKYAEFYRGLAGSPLIRKLVDDSLLIRTEISSACIEGHNLILEHPLLPTVSYPFEWTPSMFKDAALTVLNLNIILMKNGLCTHDAHLWNILFDGTKPKFVDFTSIIKTPPDRRWRAVQGFKDAVLNPLLLMSKGHTTSARYLMREIFYYPDEALMGDILGIKIKKASPPRVVPMLRDLLDPLPFSIGQRARKILNFLKNTKFKIDSARINGVHEVEVLLNRVLKLDVKPKESRWSTYYCGRNELPVYDGSRRNIDALRGSTPKIKIIEKLLVQINPETVLDIGCNRGLFSQLAALNGARVVGIDMDEMALDQMYNDSIKLGTNVIPLYINAVAPAEAIGFKEIPFPSVTDRLKADCVLCLALVHHLVFMTTHMSFEHIAKVLSSYSNKFLIVEFIPKEDKHISSWYTDEFSWYSCENLKKALYKHFSMIEVFESFPSPRVILFCKKQ